MSRTQILIRSLVELADTMVDDFDVVELLTLLADRCVEALDVSASGLMLAAADGDLRVVASSNEATRLLELFELQAAEGPCLDCFRTCASVSATGVATMSDRWPRFVPVMLGAGYGSAYAIPMRLRGSVIGALNLFRVQSSLLAPDDVLAAQALADVATIAILQHRADREIHMVNQQLTHALDSRIVIEQAKGVISQSAGVDMETAFAQLRRYSRSHHRLLSNVARDIVDGDLPSGALEPAAPESTS